MSEQSQYVEVLEPATQSFFLTAIALRGGAIAVGRARSVDTDSRLEYAHYHSVTNLNDLGYPKSGEPRTNAIAWYIKNIVTTGLSIQVDTTVEIWLCDQIAYGHLVDHFDVMPAVVSDKPENKALRELLTTLAYYKNKYKIHFKIGYLSKETHPSYTLALNKIPQGVKVLPTMINIRKKEVRIIEGVDGLKDLGEKCVIGGNSLLLKTEHRHLVPQERDDLDFVSTMEDTEEPVVEAVVGPKGHIKTALSGFIMESETERLKDLAKTEDVGDIVIKAVTRRKDYSGRTSADFFTVFQKGWDIFKFLGDLGIKFFGRFRDQDTPQAIEKIYWYELDNPRISVYWGGSFGYKVGNAGPFDDFNSALRHVLSVLGLSPEVYLIIDAGYFAVISGKPCSAYRVEESTEESHEYLIIETVRGLLKSSNLLKGKDGLSEADVGRLEESIKEAIQGILGGDASPEEATPAPTSTVDAVINAAIDVEVQKYKDSLPQAELDRIDDVAKRAVQSCLDVLNGPEEATPAPTSTVEAALRAELLELNAKLLFMGTHKENILQIDVTIDDLQNKILSFQEQITELDKRKKELQELDDLEDTVTVERRRDKILAFLAD